MIYINRYTGQQISVYAYNLLTDYQKTFYFCPCN